MSVSHLGGDGAGPYADQLGSDASDLVGGAADDAEYLVDSTHISPGLAASTESLEFEMVNELLGELNAEILSDTLIAGKAQAAGADAGAALLEKDMAVTQGVGIQPNELLINELPAAKLLAEEMPNVQGTLHGLNDPPAPNSIGGPFWGAEAAWKRTAKSEGKDKKPGSDTKHAETDEHADDEHEEDDSSHSRKRHAAWREYYETDLERRLRKASDTPQLGGE